MKKYHVLFTAVIFSLAAFPAFAAEEAKPKGTLIDFSVEASRSAPNDMARATVYAEASGANPGELAKKVNNTIDAALKTAKTFSRIKTQSSGVRTYPSYGKDGRITGWRMRSELELETIDMAALSELMGWLQETLAVGQLSLLPAPETRKKAEDEATLEALAAFQAKAKLIADALKKTYRIRQMNINGSQPMERPMMMRASKMTAMDAAPAPIEAGESRVLVTISGQIELPLE
jgi:predicted secreted protein